MSASSIVTINPDESFPHLNNAPIVEAIIDLRARAETEWKESVITDKVKSRLHDYPKRLSLSGFHQEFTIGPGATAEGKTIETAWTGLRCQTEDGLQVTQFQRDGFMFARLRPYEQWERLITEAMRVWAIFVDIAEPSEIQRMGLRFINRIGPIATEARVEDYLDPAPRVTRDLDLPVDHFFHQDILRIPGYPYAVRLTRTTQPEPALQPPAFGIIVDIDVFTTQAFETDSIAMERRFSEMRWLKNRIFFGCVASKALEAFT
jgi:uncharacterized protein (TIGR04255 family)